MCTLNESICQEKAKMMNKGSNYFSDTRHETILTFYTDSPKIYGTHVNIFITESQITLSHFYFSQGFYYHSLVFSFWFRKNNG